jgi:hypothetical protein
MSDSESSSSSYSSSSSDSKNEKKVEKNAEIVPGDKVEENKAHEHTEVTCIYQNLFECKATS